MIEKTSAGVVRGGGFGKPRPHLSGIGTFPARGRLPGLQRASPSTPLDVSSYVAADHSKCARHRKAQVDSVPERIPMLTTMTTDEPRSPNAESAQATPQAHGAVTRRGRHTPIRA